MAKYNHRVTRWQLEEYRDKKMREFLAWRGRLGMKPLLLTEYETIKSRI